MIKAFHASGKVDNSAQGTEPTAIAHNMRRAFCVPAPRERKRSRIESPLRPPADGVIKVPPPVKKGPLIIGGSLRSLR